MLSFVKIDKSFSCRLCGISLTKCQNWPACKFPPLSKPSPLAARIGTSFPQKTIFAKLKIPQKWQRPYITPLLCQSNISFCFNRVAKTVKLTIEFCFLNWTKCSFIIFRTILREGAKPWEFIWPSLIVDLLSAFLRWPRQLNWLHKFMPLSTTAKSLRTVAK